jgi:hypothetical protein
VSRSDVLVCGLSQCDGELRGGRYCSRSHWRCWWAGNIRGGRIWLSSSAEARPAAWQRVLDDARLFTASIDSGQYGRFCQIFTLFRIEHIITAIARKSLLQHFRSCTDLLSSDVKLRIHFIDAQTLAC